MVVTTFTENGITIHSASVADVAAAVNQIKKTTASAISRKLQSVGFENWNKGYGYGFSIRTYPDGMIEVSQADATEIYDELVAFGYKCEITSDNTEVHVYGKVGA